MSVNIDRLNRIINNLYTAVFETPQQKFNQILKFVVNNSETITLGENSTYINSTIPAPARYYAPLTITGAYVQATGLVAGITVTYPKGVCNVTQMWAAFRIKPSWAYNAAPTADPTIFTWLTDGNNRILLFYDQAGHYWRVRRDAAGVGTPVDSASTHAANAHITVIAAWTATQLKISVNGAAFTVVANATIPAAILNTFSIGSGITILDAVMYWAAIGTGTLTDADAAALSALGDTVPGWVDIPSFLTSLPSFIWPGVDSSHTPPSAYGECNYV